MCFFICSAFYKKMRILNDWVTDMQDKYCGDCYDICLIQSQFTKVVAFRRHHKRGGAAVVAVTTLLVLHVGDGRSGHV